jgi:glycosyltransferase 2 family protein
VARPATNQRDPPVVLRCASHESSCRGRPNHQVPRRTLLIVVAAAAVAALVFFLVGSPTHAVSTALDDLKGAHPAWLVAGGAAFLAAALAAAAAWHRGLVACGSSLSRLEVTRRYAAGCLANTFAPANAGEVVRVALLARAMGSDGAVLTVIGVSAVVALIRFSMVATLLVVTAASGRPLLWLAVAALPVAGLIACSFRRVRERLLSSRGRHVLDVVRGIAASPMAAVEITAWVATGVAASILAAACVSAALAVPHPLAAALVIVPAIMLARLLPITPGNVGLTSAAVALALHERGVPMNSAVAAGIALHAVELIVGLTFGAAGALSLASRVPTRSSRVRLRTWAGRTLLGAASAVLLAGVVISAIGAHAALT